MHSLCLDIKTQNCLQEFWAQSSSKWVGNILYLDKQVMRPFKKESCLFLS